MTISRPVRPTSDHPDLAALPGAVVTTTAARALAVLRLAAGFVFLWAFLDKTFGLHYSTPSAKSWINGGSPTKGFLGSVEVGPFQSLFHTARVIILDWKAAQRRNHSHTPRCRIKPLASVTGTRCSGSKSCSS